MAVTWRFRGGYVAVPWRLRSGSVAGGGSVAARWLLSWVLMSEQRECMKTREEASREEHKDE